MIKNALVTGGAGFLGYHLVRSLLDDGYKVTVIDNLQTGNFDNITKLAQSTEGKNFHFILGDVTNWETFKEVRGDFSVVYNLACPASPPKYQLNPIHTFTTSIMGATHCLNFAMLHSAKIFQASTSEVYGDPLVPVQNEQYWGNVNPIGLRACYDEGKRGAETLCVEYGRQYNVQVKIGRIFNTYGPYMDPNDGRVVSNFINQALRGEDITIYGTGNQTRSFCYVSDLIEGIRHLVDNTTSDQIYPINLGNPVDYTMNELAYFILQKTGSSSKLVYNELPSDDPTQRKPDISKARSILGWIPQIDLSRGLDETIEYFKSRM